MLLFIDWSKVLTVVLNIIFVSIPEEIFLVLFALLLLNQFDSVIDKETNIEYANGLKEFKKFATKKDIHLIVACVLTVAILSNVLRYSTVDFSAVLLISFLSMYFIILFSFKYYKSPWSVLKTFLCVISSFVLLMLIEFSYIPLILYATGKTLEEINNSVFLCFLCSIPERIIEFSLLANMIFKKASFSRMKIVKAIASNKVLTLIVASIISVNAVLLLISGKVIGFDKALASISLTHQILIIIPVLVFPIFNISALFVVIYYVINKEKCQNYNTQQELEVSITDIRFFLEKEMYGKVRKELDTMKGNINRLYN